MKIEYPKPESIVNKLFEKYPRLDYSFEKSQMIKLYKEALSWIEFANSGLDLSLPISVKIEIGTEDRELGQYIDDKADYFRVITKLFINEDGHVKYNFSLKRDSYNGESSDFQKINVYTYLNKRLLEYGTDRDKNYKAIYVKNPILFRLPGVCDCVLNDKKDEDHDTTNDDYIHDFSEIKTYLVKELPPRFFGLLFGSICFSRIKEDIENKEGILKVLLAEEKLYALFHRYRVAHKKLFQTMIDRSFIKNNTLESDVIKLLGVWLAKINYYNSRYVNNATNKAYQHKSMKNNLALIHERNSYFKI